MPVDALLTAESHYGRDPHAVRQLAVRLGGQVPPAALVFRHWHTGTPFLPQGVDLAKDPLTPRVYRGMWIVDCPCGGAQLTSKDDPRFFCIDCLNGGSRLWRRVDWPTGHQEVERILLARPDPASRNWQGEPVEQLRAENLARGMQDGVGR